MTLLAGSALDPVLSDLIPRFERSSGHTVQLDSNGAIGAMTARVRKGEAADVVIVSRPQIDLLEQEGKVISGSRADLIKVGVGVFVRAGAPKPDISSVDAFKRTRTERFAPVARGEVEIGFNQISEILAAPGVELVGPLPAAIQNYTLFTAGIVASSTQVDAARSFIRFMASPDALAAMRAKGFE